MNHYPRSINVNRFQFIQEELRSWGEQSAQYTGIWHLIPWVMEVAGEPEEMESFTVEI